MPHTVRLPYISFRVANSEAVTVQSRVAGFVTIGPTFNLCVASRIRLKITNGSSHSRWESNAHMLRETVRLGPPSELDHARRRRVGLEDDSEVHDLIGSL